MQPTSSFFDGFFFAMTTLGVLGALIDFIIGKPGQRRLRDELTNWWAVLSDVRWHNFGKKEAAAAIKVLDSVVGAHLFSWKRLQASLIIVLIAAVIGGVIAELSLNPSSPPDAWTSSYHRFYGSAGFLAGTLMVAISFSVTRLLSSVIVHLGSRANVVCFLLLVAVQLALFIVWPPVVFVMRVIFESALGILSLAIGGEFALAYKSIERTIETFPLLVSFTAVDFAFIRNEPIARLLEFRYGGYNPCNEAGCAIRIAFFGGRPDTRCRCNRLAPTLCIGLPFFLRLSSFDPTANCHALVPHY
jgi:hypothetical protein